MENKTEAAAAAMEEGTRKLIREYLAANPESSIPGAAAALGLSPATVYRYADEQ